MQGRMQGGEVNSEFCVEFIPPERIWLEYRRYRRMGAESGIDKKESQGERLHPI